MKNIKSRVNILFFGGFNLIFCAFYRFLSSLKNFLPQGTLILALKMSMLLSHMKK